MALYDTLASAILYYRHSERVWHVTSQKHCSLHMQESITIWKVVGWIIGSYKKWMLNEAWHSVWLYQFPKVMHYRCLKPSGFMPNGPQIIPLITFFVAVNIWKYYFLACTIGKYLTSNAHAVHYFWYIWWYIRSSLVMQCAYRYSDICVITGDHMHM